MKRTRALTQSLRNKQKTKRQKVTSEHSNNITNDTVCSKLVFDWTR